MVDDVPSSRRIGRAALLLVVIAAALLRFWGLDHGLPHPSTRPDEREVVQFTRGFPAGDLNPRWFIYPNQYLYVVWMWNELWLAVRRLAVPTPAYAAVVATDVPLLLLAGRALSAVAGVATVALTWMVGRSIGHGVGLLAAILVCVNSLLVRDSHALKPDTLLTLSTLAGLACLARWHERPDTRFAAGAGAVIGAATGLKYNAILLLVPAWVSGVMRAGGRGWRRLVPERSLLVLATVAIVVFVATGPYMLLDFDRFRFTFFFAMFAEYANRPDGVPSPQASWLGTLATLVRSRAFGYHLDVSLRHGCGLAMALATPFALAYAWRRPRRPILVLAAVFAVLYFLVLGASPVKLTRYFTPIVPLLALLIAHLVMAIARGIPSRRLRWAMLAAATTALAAEPLTASILYDRLVARPDTRVEALRWMERALPPGAVVAVLGGTWVEYADPILPAGAVKLPRDVRPADYARHGVGYVVTHEHLLKFSRPDPATLRDLAPHLTPLAEWNPYPGGPAGYYEQEDAFYVPTYGFSGVERPGPLVRVYAYRP